MSIETKRQKQKSGIAQGIERGKLDENGLTQALDFHQMFSNLMPDYAVDETLCVDETVFSKAYEDFCERLTHNYPFFHPMYFGQMLKPPHPVAMIGYLTAMTINPNNHALDGGPPTAEMEKDVVKQFATQFGYGDEFLGHLTSSGTMANLEALWVSREIHNESGVDKAIAYSAQAHYTHGRMSDVLKVPSVKIKATPQGVMDLDDLKSKLESENIGTVVVTLGTTALGMLEPLTEILKLKETFDFRIHVDMAYGGYYQLLAATSDDFVEYRLLSQVDSIVIDPHKHGLQPYGCGCVLFKDPTVQKFYRHDSPYTYFSSDDLHLGEISLECSRAGAAAAALWLTLKCFPLKEDRGMGSILKKTREAGLEFAKAIQQSKEYELYLEPQLDIVAYYSTASSTSEITQLSKAILKSGMRDTNYPAFIATVNVSADDFKALHPDITVDTETVTILRSCLMKPEHLDWVDRLIQILEHHARLMKNY